MQPKVKTILSLVLLFVGMFTLLEGSKITSSGRPEMVDLVLIVAGAVLVLAYMPLVGNYLETTLKTARTINLMPMLMALGAALIFQGATRTGADDISQLLFVGLGIALVIGSVFVIYKAMAGKKKR